MCTQSQERRRRKDPFFLISFFVCSVFFALVQFTIQFLSLPLQKRKKSFAPSYLILFSYERLSLFLSSVCHNPRLSVATKSSKRQSFDITTFPPSFSPRKCCKKVQKLYFCCVPFPLLMGGWARRMLHCSIFHLSLRSIRERIRPIALACLSKLMVVKATRPGYFCHRHFLFNAQTSTRKRSREGHAQKRNFCQLISFS